MKIVLSRTWSLISLFLYQSLPSSTLCVCLFCFVFFFVCLFCNLFPSS